MMIEVEEQTVTGLVGQASRYTRSHPLLSTVLANDLRTAGGSEKETREQCGRGGGGSVGNWQAGAGKRETVCEAGAGAGRVEGAGRTGEQGAGGGVLLGARVC